MIFAQDLYETVASRVYFGLFSCNAALPYEFRSLVMVLGKPPYLLAVAEIASCIADMSYGQRLPFNKRYGKSSTHADPFPVLGTVKEQLHVSLVEYGSEKVTYILFFANGK